MARGSQATKTGRQALSRREVLKALAAGGGALAASAFLPARWVKPAIQAGVLPAHAQASLCNVQVTIRRASDCANCPGGNIAYCSYTPTGSPPVSLSASYGGLGVPSTLNLGTAGHFDFDFALPGVPTQTHILHIEVTFQNGCTASADFTYNPPTR